MQQDAISFMRKRLLICSLHILNYDFLLFLVWFTREITMSQPLSFGIISSYELVKNEIKIKNRNKEIASYFTMLCFCNFEDFVLVSSQFHLLRVYSLDYDQLL